jgi:selenoprotein W-related protein
VSAIEDLLKNYQHIIAETRLLNGSKGIFDVIVDGDMLYSKHETGRHAESGEVLSLFRDKYAEGVAIYGT